MPPRPPAEASPGNPYESERILSEYLLFHYGSAGEILPPDAPSGMRQALDFPVRSQAHFTGKAGCGLDIGCAVGRSTFEMSRNCDEVLGIDFSHAFIRAAERLKSRPRRYQRLDEGNLTTRLEARLPAGVDPSRVHFEQGDAMNLRTDLREFDRVHAANLLCRLSEPRKLLSVLPYLVRPGGELVLATPCTWLAEFTPPVHWPPGSTLDWLKESLAGSFELIRTADEPFLIRETARKFQWSTSLVSVWGRT